LDDSGTFGKCTAGFYCISGASTSSPTDGTTGDRCPKGSACPLGSAYHQYCSIGEYQKNKGLGTCTTCDEGFYCGEIGLTEASSCTAFHYCELGSKIMTPCPPGTYR
jgi:hypothetical protein